MNKKDIQRLVLSSLFLAIGLVLPFLTGQLKEIGDSILPMHLPVMLCGIICGWQYGLTIGIIMPPLRSLIFGMPPLYPNSIWMALELATYGFVVGLLYMKSKNKSVGYLYFSLIASMISGRIVWGASKAILLGLGGKSFTIKAFIAGGFIDAIPGIIIQLVLIPVIILLFKRTNLRELMEKK